MKYNHGFLAFKLHNTTQRGCDIRYSLSILNSKLEETNVFYRQTFLISGSFCGCDTFIAGDNFFKDALDLLPKGNLTFDLKVRAAQNQKFQ
jgi:hypothetical protein